MKKTLFVAFALTLICIQTSAQIDTISFKLPQIIKNEAPFLKDEFYNISFSEFSGEDGMFVFVIDKSAYLKYCKAELTSQIVKQFKDNRLMIKHCYDTRHICGDEFKQFIDFDTEVSLLDNTVRLNTSLVSKYRIILKGKAKTRYWHQDWWGHCDRETDVDWINLVSATITVKQHFSFRESTESLNVKNTINGEFSILYNGCSSLVSSPYTRRREIEVGPTVLQKNFSFSTLEPIALSLFRSMMLNTTEIKITEDKTNYYVYCIRKEN